MIVGLEIICGYALSVPMSCVDVGILASASFTDCFDDLVTF